MLKYTQNDLVSIAKRINNTKRTYLLVNPLQSKHIPISPKTALDLMAELGSKVKRYYPQTKLVIGFAETATAIGAVVAKSISEDCAYIHTTREDCGENIRYIDFLEEHSHATEQRLVSTKLEQFIEQTNTIVFVDDEISTGNTLLNIIRELKSIYPAIKNKKIVVASIISRVSCFNELKMKNEGIDSVYIIKIENTDYDSALRSVCVSEPIRVSPSNSSICSVHVESISDPRIGVTISTYFEEINNLCKDLYFKLKDIIDGRILVLGTEETMLPALILAQVLEQSGHTQKTVCHSTTRSPIGVSTNKGYPIHSGYKIHSFYDSFRENYIYNIDEYDTALVFTDAKNYNKLAAYDLLAILNNHSCDRVVFIIGDKNV